MSQQEFDNYLAFLTRLLQIAPQQRQQVADEFRAHMEDRLDELLARGIPRDQAIQLALEEFGDAAGLANQLANISKLRKRRWYMKVSAFSVAGLAACGLLAIALWPESPRLPATGQAVAQQPAPKGRGKGLAVLKPTTMEEKMAQRINVDFVDVPLGDVFSYLKDSADIQFYINRHTLETESVAIDSPVTMQLKDIRVETVLDLALEQVSNQLTYVERDGVLIVSTITALEGATEVRVYNCRDLLALTTGQPGPGMGMGIGMDGMTGGGMMGMGMPGGMAMPGMPGMPGMGNRMRPVGPPPDIGQPAPSGGGGLQTPSIDPSDPDRSEYGAPPAEGGGGTPQSPSPVQDERPPAGMGWIDLVRERSIAAQFGGAGAAPSGMPGMMGGMGGAMPGNGGGASGRPEPQTDHERRAARLMNLITTAVDPDTWSDVGGFGTISEYEGLIVVNHNARTHKKIESVLTMLRESAGMPLAPHLPVTGGMGAMMGAPGGGFLPNPGSLNPTENPGSGFGGTLSDGTGLEGGPLPTPRGR